MSREREITTNQKQEEMTIIARYAQQEGIPYDLVVENLEVNPFDDFFNEYFEGAKERVLYTFATMYFRSMPGNDMDIEAPKFIGGLGEYKNRLENSVEIMSIPQAADAVGLVDVDSAANFFAFMHGKYLGQAVAELAADEFLGDGVVTRLVYWSKLDKIARESISRLTPEIMYEAQQDTF